MGYSPQLPMPHLARLTSPKSVIISPLGPSCSFLTPRNRKKHSNFSYGTDMVLLEMSAARAEKNFQSLEMGLCKPSSLVSDVRKRLPDSSQVEMLEETSSGYKNEKPPRTIQKQTYIKWIDMEQWHISPKEQTTTRQKHVGASSAKCGKYLILYDISISNHYSPHYSPPFLVYAASSSLSQSNSINHFFLTYE